MHPFTLVHGIVVKPDYLHIVAELARARYAICITYDHACAPEHGEGTGMAGSLAMLSSGGAPLLRGVEKPRRLQQHLLVSRGPDGMHDRVDAYLQHTFGTSWTTACADLVREAKVRVDRERETHMTQALQQLSHGLKDVEELRQRFIERAVVLEVAGSSLSRICAFAIVKLHRPDVEDKICGLGDEYGRQLLEAKCRVKLFEERDSRFASTLVAGMTASIV